LESHNNNNNNNETIDNQKGGDLNEAKGMIDLEERSVHHPDTTNIPKNRISNHDKKTLMVLEEFVGFSSKKTVKRILLYLKTFPKEGGEGVY
jgi:hypothetical protein